jgi:hypothetical protein
MEWVGRAGKVFRQKCITPVQSGHWAESGCPYLTLYIEPSTLDCYYVECGRTNGHSTVVLRCEGRDGPVEFTVSRYFRVFKLQDDSTPAQAKT